MTTGKSPVRFYGFRKKSAGRGEWRTTLNLRLFSYQKKSILRTEVFCVQIHSCRAYGVGGDGYPLAYFRVA